MTRRTGRRPGASGTREAILDAARRRFADAGYRGATIRAIAADAEVDPALVHHYFGTKQELFAAVVEFPVSPSVVVERLEHVSRDEAGAQVMRTYLSVWDLPQYQDRMRILLHGAMADERSAQAMREFVVDVLLEPVVRQLGLSDPRLRALLVATQVIGLSFLRYLVPTEPIASMSSDDVVAAYGPTIQRYLTGDLDLPGAGS